MLFIKMWRFQSTSSLLRGFFCFSSWTGIRFREMLLCQLIWLHDFFPLSWSYDWFSNVELAWHTWNKPHLVTLYNSFYTLSDSAYWYFGENFCVLSHEIYWSLVFVFLYLCLVWYQANTGLVNELEDVLSPPFFKIMKNCHFFFLMFGKIS